MSQQIQTLIRTRPEIDVWRKRPRRNARCRPSIALYFQELCRAHIPVLNELIQKYRLATYDPFAFEVSPWDVPNWHLERGREIVNCNLVPYLSWDHLPVIPSRDGMRRFHRLIEPQELRAGLTLQPTPGELELLDAMNFMHRGNYSDAVRRAYTAIEALVGGRVRTLIESREGTEVAEAFLKRTRMRFPERIKKYESLTQRTPTDAQWVALDEIRELRNRIVHRGYRLTTAKRFIAERLVFAGRLIFNWFEDDAERRKRRETRVAFRNLGRDALAGVFRPVMTPKGVVLSPLQMGRPVPEAI